MVHFFETVWSALEGLGVQIDRKISRIEYVKLCECHRFVLIMKGYDEKRDTDVTKATHFEAEELKRN